MNVLSIHWAHALNETLMVWEQTKLGEPDTWVNAGCIPQHDWFPEFPGLPPLKSLVSFPHAGSASAIGPQDHSFLALWDPRGGESKLVTWKQDPPRRGRMGETKIKWPVLSTSPSSPTSSASFLSIWCWIILCYGRGWSSCALYGVEQPPWPLPAGCP